MTDLIVAGGGEGFYKNLYPVTKSKDPNLGMRIVAVVDVVPFDKLPMKSREIIQAEGIEYVDDYLKLDERKYGESDVAGVVMTPNEYHLAWASYFASRNIPVYVEKPAVTSLSDLREFFVLARQHPHLIYAAEYCVDGKGAGVLRATGNMAWGDPRRQYIDGCHEYVPGFFHSMGKLKAVRGKLLEGEGTAGSADHRTWLLDGVHGGMIRDLASHLFGIVYDVGLVNADVMWTKVTLGKYEPGMALGEFRPLASSAEGETYASMEGRFLSPYGTPEFQMDVGKYWPTHERSLELLFEGGSATFSYEKPFLFRFDRDKSNFRITVEHDFYPSLAFLDFKQFLEGKQHGHIGRAAAIVRFNEEARMLGLLQAGLR